MDVREWAGSRGLLPLPSLGIVRRLKSICVNEDAENGGTVVVGTSYGDVFIIGIGSCV